MKPLVKNVFVIACLVGIAGFALRPSTSRMITDKYPDGSLKSQAFIDSDGKLHGTSTEFFPNGKIKSKVELTHGVWTGVSVQYDEDGRVVWQADASTP